MQPPFDPWGDISENRSVRGDGIHLGLLQVLTAAEMLVELQRLPRGVDAYDDHGKPQHPPVARAGSPQNQMIICR
jgi:hypothetical protein